MTEPTTPDAYLHLDFETTGKDPVYDRVIEVGAILTDGEHNEFGRFESLVDPSQFGLLRMAPGTPAGDMHRSSGLHEDLIADGAPLLSTHDVESALLALIDAWLHPSASVVLAGSGVAAFDLQFIRAQMPRLAERMEYYASDVGQLRREWRTATGFDLVDVNKSKTHRAMDDVECHLAEARAFRLKLRELVEYAPPF